MGNTVMETGRRDYRRCEVERAETHHREETTGLWRCVSCGYAKGEDLRVPHGRTADG